MKDQKKEKKTISIFHTWYFSIIARLHKPVLIHLVAAYTNRHSLILMSPIPSKIRIICQAFQIRLGIGNVCQTFTEAVSTYIH